MNNKWLLGLLLGVIGSAHAAVSVPNIEKVKKNISANFSIPLDHIQPTPIPNIYSGQNQGRVVYFDDKGEYLLIGEMIRLSDQKNLTQQIVDEANRVDWDQLPFEQAIKTVKGKGERQVVVFSDPNCPYCKNFEKVLAKMDNVTIYTFIYALKPQSKEVSKQVWCEKNPSQAWHDLLTQNVQPTAKADCKHPIDQNLELGKRLNINGTPAMIFSNGMRQMGAVNEAQLEQLFNEHQAK